MFRSEINKSLEGRQGCSLDESCQMEANKDKSIQTSTGCCTGQLWKIPFHFLVSSPVTETPEFAKKKIVVSPPFVTVIEVNKMTDFYSSWPSFRTWLFGSLTKHISKLCLLTLQFHPVPTPSDKVWVKSRQNKDRRV